MELDIPREIKQVVILFIEILYLAHKTPIYLPDIELLEAKCKDFCDLVEKYLGLVNCTHVIHRMEHLGRCIRLLGPLPVTWLFTAERYMRHLMNFIHGSRYPAEQIFYAGLSYEFLFHCKRQKPHIFFNGSDRALFLKQYEPHVKKTFKVAGARKEVDLSEGDLSALAMYLNHNVRPPVPLTANCLQSSAFKHSTAICNDTFFRASLTDRRQYFWSDFKRSTG
jgi:hypothetical protein